jgi:hypothetical protein
MRRGDRHYIITVDIMRLVIGWQLYSESSGGGDVEGAGI